VANGNGETTRRDIFASSSRSHRRRENAIKGYQELRDDFRLPVRSGDFAVSFYDQ